MHSTKPKQWTIFPRGGAQRGAGRKPKGDRPLVAHTKRPARTRHDPVLVTTRLLAGLPNLRRGVVCDIVREALCAGAERFGFRLVEFSLQRDLLHLIAEADDQRALSRGMQGLLIRVAKRLNRAWQRHGTVFRDRYHAQELKSPRHVRYALVYVLQNARKHREIAAGIDPLSSGPWFRGWLDRVASAASPLPRASAWLLTTGWQRAGLLSTTERPALSPPWA
jgi:putative transposase